MATVKTWLDGRMQTVQTDDPRLAEIEAHRVLTAHVANMRRLDLAGRRDYLAGVERTEGPVSGMKLRLAFAADWTGRNPANAKLSGIVREEV